MSTTTPRGGETFGLTVEPTQYRPVRTVLADVESVGAGVALRVGVELDVAGWEQSGYVVLDRDEARRLASLLWDAAGGA
jgi:hypothetical protein